MKKLVLYISVLVFFSGTAYCTEPVKGEKVHSMIKVKKSEEWYENQMEYWGEFVKTHNQDAEAWLNYYTATRMLKLKGRPGYHEKMTGIVDQMEKHIPESFEFNYVKYWNGGNKTELFSYLEKAYAIDPNRPELFDDYSTYYELKRDKLSRRQICIKWYQSEEIAPEIYAFNYNMLMSTEENAILFTNGDNDTYPAWVLQDALDIRQDVKVINNSLLLDPDYRSKYLAELSISDFKKEMSDYGNDWVKYTEAIREHIYNNTSRPMYFASSCYHILGEELEKDLYVVGLAYLWTKDRVDNIAILRKNVENHFVMDHLKVRLGKNRSDGVADVMSSSYLFPLLKLRNHYKESGEKSKQLELEGIIEEIGNRSGLEKDVSQALHPEKATKVSEVFDDPREAMWGMRQVDDTLWASQREISNDRYDLFLEDLLMQRRFDDLGVARYIEVDWNEHALPIYKQYSEEEIFAHGDPRHPFFPVMNIRYEAAVMYCEWLTNIYNNIEHKRKQFKKVKFRLPTEAEWEYIARGGKEGDYPWSHLFGSKTTNDQGCYLANLQTGKRITNEEDKCPEHDGGVFPVKSHSYHPNEYGLYCVIGNVAEMTAEKGVAKGGGWRTPGGEAKIGKKQMYQGPDPNVGFRVIMEVIEE